MAFEEDGDNIEITDGIERNEELEELTPETELESAPETNIEELTEIETSSRTKNRQPDRHTLEVRRAIEDHLEKLRLRKELDYLFDGDFTKE